jgi:hypothetical protein
MQAEHFSNKLSQQRAARKELLTIGHTPNTLGQDYINAYIS